MIVNTSNQQHADTCPLIERCSADTPHHGVCGYSGTFCIHCERECNCAPTRIDAPAPTPQQGRNPAHRHNPAYADLCPGDDCDCTTDQMQDGHRVSCKYMDCQCDLIHAGYMLGLYDALAIAQNLPVNKDYHVWRPYVTKAIQKRINENSEDN